MREKIKIFGYHSTFPEREREREREKERERESRDISKMGNSSSSPSTPPKKPVLQQYKSKDEITVTVKRERKGERNA